MRVRELMTNQGACCVIAGLPCEISIKMTTNFEEELEKVKLINSEMIKTIELQEKILENQRLIGESLDCKGYIVRDVKGNPLMLIEY